MKKLFVIVLITVGFILPVAAVGGDVEVSGIKTKIREKDSSGDVWFAIKANVLNLGGDEKVRVTLQAIDRDGFEVDDLTLRGSIPPGSEKILTEKTYMPHSEFEQIRTWQVK